MIRCAKAILPPILLTVLTLSLAVAAPVEPRPYAPVQGGYAPSAEVLQPYAAGRVMVRLTEAGYRASDLHVATKSAVRKAGDRVPGDMTGLSSLDAVARDAGVTGILQAHGPFADRAAAERVGALSVFVFELSADADVPAAAALLAADPTVESATPDYRAYPAVVPNDFSYPANWGHDNQAQLPGYDWTGSYDHTLAPVGMPGFDADADMAWDAPTAYGSPTVVIAIIDTGVDQMHVDLMQVPGYDYGDNDPNPHDDAAGVAGHGTCCAGIAAAIADNGQVAAGVAGGCAVMPLKVADSTGGLFLSYVANALYFAANNGANVASMSFSTAGITSDPNMDPALLYAYNAGVTLVAAAGNDNNSVVDYPANSQYVIAVGAASPCGERKRSSSLASELSPGVLPDPLGYTCDGERWWGSNYGMAPQDAPGALDMLAPTILPTTDITGAAGYRAGDFEPWFNGTSCSAPYVAGVCALVLSANPGVSPANMRTQLVSTCTDVLSVESTPGWDVYSGYGLVNANMAVITPIVPVAGFSASTTSGCVPLMVGFTDQSQGLITTWNWNFGDGGMDFVQNPMYQYPQPGTYTVSLTVSGPNGTDTLTLTDLITVDPMSTSEFSGTPLVGDAPLAVTFTDASLDSPTFWQWDFGDGGSSNLQSPVHTYNAPGRYTVMLTTNNACGGDTMTKTDYVLVCGQAPTAAFTCTPTAGADTLTVSFTDQTGGEPLTWAWDFGDGGVSTDINPTHYYTAPGRYSVTLITANDCYADTVTATDVVVLATTTDAPGAPPARFEMSANYPNPFNPTTTIDFALPQDGPVRLEIFDASGRSLGVPIDRAMPAGRHEFTWRPERLPSGVYFFKLAAGEEMGIRRVVLIR